ncbi:hypothetical protein IC229_33995 [Spirosoma sp. BT702]|uniref:Uncharacterized protein n=1 Tax=Spirosoma profusum TaxID=2771354 RepID=A0A927GB40_9BACT|nr:hypothetical protein [Spirosoma profusum]MBD2705670.1 hypothetical protein [Spirosoma profusum]
MKSLLVTIITLICLTVHGQALPNKFDIHTWKPPYTLRIPDKWTTERFPIPIDFAPQISYKGIEDLRFAPGWAKQSSPDYWSYAFLWWLEGRPQINAASLQKDLTAYYSGLVGRNIVDRHIMVRKETPTNVSIRKLPKSASGDDMYEGTITMLDYMAQKPITLNCVIHVTSCRKYDRTGVLFELSPKPTEHANWQKLHSVQSSFVCSK